MTSPRSALTGAIAGAFTRLSQMRSAARSTDSAPAAAAHASSRLESDLRAALAMRSWINPRELLPPQVEQAVRVRTLNAVASDVETSFRQHPGEWYLAAPVRRRIFGGIGRDGLRAKLQEPASPRDESDPVRRALRRLLDLEPLDLASLTVDELRAIENAAEWLEDLGLNFSAVRTEAVSLAARRKREAEIARLTATPLIGRQETLDQLQAFTSAARAGKGRMAATYLYGIGGMGKSTILAHLEKRLSATDAVLVHIDFDRVDLDPSDPISLDLVVLEQLSARLPDLAGQCRSLSELLSQFRSRTRREKLESVGSGSRSAPRRAIKRKGPSLALEAIETREGSERDSILYGSLARLPPSPLIVIVDTLEVVYARGAAAVGDLAKWLDSLSTIARAGDVRVVLAGRDPPPDDANRNICARLESLSHEVQPPIPLRELDFPQAMTLLVEAGLNDRSLAEAAAKALPGNPLVLRMAAEIYTKSPELLQEIRLAHEAGRIDPVTASRYLAERVVAHLSDPVARPYALAAMALPQVREELVRDVVLPVVDGHARGSADRAKAKRVYDALASAGWLVVPALDGASFTYHPEIRALVRKFIDADPDKFAQQKDVRAAAISWHRRRRDKQDRAFALYHRLMLGEKTIGRRDCDLAPLLTRFLDDLPADTRQALTDGMPASPSSRHRPPDTEWTAYLEGRGVRDGQGDKLLKRGRAAEALALYRERPTRPKGLPPTFVIQALADNCEWDTSEVDVEMIVRELNSQIRQKGRIPGGLLSRVYWLTRYEMLRHPGPLQPAHLRLLETCTRSLNSSSMAMPALIATAEALSKVELAPRDWVQRGGSVPDARLHLVRGLKFPSPFAAKVNADALVVLQRDWVERLESSCKGIDLPLKDLQEVQDELQSLQGQAFAGISRTLRQFRKPVLLRCREPNPTGILLLLRGTTIEFHRPLKSALAALYTECREHGDFDRFEPVWDAIGTVLQKMSIAPREMNTGALRELVAADASEWFGALVSYSDRCRLLPALLSQLTSIAGSGATFKTLNRSATAFALWDRALCQGQSSAW